MKTVVLLGKGDLAIRIGTWLVARPDFRIQAIVPVVPEPAWAASFSAWGKEGGIPVITSGRFQDLEPSGSRERIADVVLSVFYDRILTADFLDRFGRALNLHNGPLPRYRGMAPINWALKNGEREHGVTLHEMIPRIDAGPILAQVRFSIFPEIDEVSDVYGRALEFGFVVATEALPRLDLLPGVPQDENLASYYNARDMDRLFERRDFTRELSLRGARAWTAPVGAAGGNPRAPIRNGPRAEGNPARLD